MFNNLHIGIVPPDLAAAGRIQALRKEIHAKAHRIQERSEVINEMEGIERGLLKKRTEFAWKVELLKKNMKAAKLEATSLN